LPADQPEPAAGVPATGWAKPDRRLVHRDGALTDLPAAEAGRSGPQGRPVYGTDP
jgi:hypothetical protein